MPEQNKPVLSDEDIEDWRRTINKLGFNCRQNISGETLMRFINTIELAALRFRSQGATEEREKWEKEMAETLEDWEGEVLDLKSQLQASRNEVIEECARKCEIVSGLTDELESVRIATICADEIRQLKG